MGSTPLRGDLCGARASSREKGKLIPAVLPRGSPPGHGGRGSASPAPLRPRSGAAGAPPPQQRHPVPPCCHLHGKRGLGSGETRLGGRAQTQGEGKRPASGEGVRCGLLVPLANREPSTELTLLIYETRTEKTTPKPKPNQSKTPKQSPHHNFPVFKRPNMFPGLFKHKRHGNEYQ